MSNPSLELNFEKFEDIVKHGRLTRDLGKIVGSSGLILKGHVPGAIIGSICKVYTENRDEPALLEVVGFHDREILLMPLEDVSGLGPGSKLIVSRQSATVKVGSELLGRVVGGLGRPLDGKGDIEGAKEISIYREVCNPLDRRPIREALDLGVRSLNGMLTIGRGQRVGIMAGSGVGKSVLMGMMARNSKADVNVIALIGERGREVREFIENDLGPEGMKRSVIVAVTSDQSPLLRMRGAFVASAIAESFADEGKDVLLMMDSVTRFAMAQREIGLSIGEPPASKGYTPSVFSMLPKLLERAGSFEGKGSITGLYTVLVEGDDMDDPIGDSVRSIVDGHIVLSRHLAQRGHFPSVDVLQSASRVMRNVVTDEHYRCALKLRELLAIYHDAEDLINIGAYKPGVNAKVDTAVQAMDSIERFLKQPVEDASSFNEGLHELMAIAERAM